MFKRERQKMKWRRIDRKIKRDREHVKECQERERKCLREKETTRVMGREREKQI